MSPVTNYSKLLKGSLVRATNEKNTQTEDMQGNLRYGMIWFQSFQAQWQKESRTIIYGEFCSILYKRLRRFPLKVRAISAKIKLPKKYLQHCHILRTDKKNLSLLLLPS